MQAARRDDDDDLGTITGTLHSPKLQHYWSPTIRLFSVISRQSLGTSYPSAGLQSEYSIAPVDWAENV